MKEISKIIEGMMKDAKRLIDESKITMDEQNNWRNTFLQGQIMRRIIL
jgi:hypothetical protein